MAYEFPVAYPDAPEGAVMYVGPDGAVLGVERPADWAAKLNTYVLGFNAAGHLAWRELTSDTLVPTGLTGDLTSFTADSTAYTADQTES